MRHKLTTAQVLSQFLPSYRQHHRLSPQQAKITRLLCLCRTPALGGQCLRCDHCAYQADRYCSCRNRHCPQCHGRATAQWFERQHIDLLPVPYFHVIFTLPHALSPWVQLHPSTVYGLLFQSVWSTLKRFGQNPKRLNGQLGVTAVLHTWGQNLGRHVHLHCLIPGGALSPDGKEWHRAKSNYLFPVKALSRHFRGVMVSALRQALNDGRLPRITDQRAASATLTAVMSTPWVVFSRGTGMQSQQVLGYLARYTHRIALADERLVKLTSDSVYFGYRDSRHGNTPRTMALSGDEFVRRWLQHVLPHGFMRIRHYGFLANCHRRRKLQQIRRCLAVPDVAQEVESSTETLRRVDSARIWRCPRCHDGVMRVVSEAAKVKRRPSLSNQ